MWRHSPAWPAGSPTWLATTVAGPSRSIYHSPNWCTATASLLTSRSIPRSPLSPRSRRGPTTTYLRSYADSVRDFGHPVVIGFGHEMNATWYSWGYEPRPAETFVAAWRHIVTLFNERGRARTSPGCGRSTRITPEPGRSPMVARRQVTSPGSASTGTTSSHPTRSTASSGAPFSRFAQFTKKPILLSETAVSPKATPQFAKIGDLFTGMQKYRTLGLVWFDKDQNDDGYRHQDWRH